MKWMCVLFCLLLTVAVATPVAQAGATNPGLSNSEEPGSVLVFPIFRTGTQTTSDLGTVPNTVFEISLVCPPVAVEDAISTPFVCNHTTVYTVHAEWVCAGTGTFPFKVCQESDFTFPITVDGTVRFDPNNITPVVPGVVTVSPPPCNQGYLLAWVTDGSDRPVKFDGLIGDAVLRESPSAATAYNAIPIQADPAVYTTDPPTLLSTDGTNGELEFDGGPGHYQMVTGKIYGSVRYTNPSVSATSAVATSLVLLTLDVDSGRINLPTFVDLNFFSELQAQVSRHTQFTCWNRDASVVPIPSQIFGATKGVVASGTASQQLLGNVTLLGLIITEEKAPGPKGAILREYAYPFYNDSVPIDTDFDANPGGGAKVPR